MAAGPHATAAAGWLPGGGTMHTALKVALVVVAVALVLLLRQGCVLYDEAAAASRDQWNCVVSDLIPVREPQKPYWTPDWGVTWLEVEVE